MAVEEAPTEIGLSCTITAESCLVTVHLRHRHMSGEAVVVWTSSHSTQSFTY